MAIKFEPNPQNDCGLIVESRFYRALNNSTLDCVPRMYSLGGTYKNCHLVIDLLGYDLAKLYYFNAFLIDKWYVGVHSASKQQP